MKTVVFFLIALSFSIASAQEWKQLPGPTRSNARQIEVDKFGSIYALTDSNEIYRSDDSGKSWVKFRVPTKIASTQTLQLFCSKSGAIYISATKYSTSGYVHQDTSSIGIYRSIDKGVNWKQVISNRYFASLVDNGTNIVYGTTDWYANSSSTELYQSTDFGVTWKSFKSFDFMANRFDVDISNRIYIQPNNGTKIWVYANDGAYLGQIEDSTITKNENGYVAGVFKVLGNNRFAFLSDSVFYYKIGDGNWVRKSRVTNDANSKASPVLLVGAQGRLLIIVYSYNGPQTYSLLSSTDLGLTWQKIYTTSNIPNSLYMAIDSSQHYLFSDAYGMNRFNIANSSQETIGFPIATIMSMIVDKNGDIHAVDSGYSSGSNLYSRLLKSSDQGKSWIEEFGQYHINGNIGLSPDSGVFCIYDSLPFSSQNGLQQLLHYDPTSLKWEKITSLEYVYYPKEYRFFPPSTIYIDASRSDNNGMTWEGLYCAPPVSFVYNHSFSVAAPGKVLIGYRPAIYMTEDNGITWRKLNHRLVDRNITSLYANAEGFILAGSEYGDIIRSNDNGSTWNDWRGSLQGSINKITSTVDNTIFVATSKGLFSRGLNDADWKLELADKEIVYIGFGKDNEVFACASRDGIWTDGKKHFVMPKEGVKQKGIAGILVSPNPAVSTITAGFDMNTSGRATISLVDELGREVLSKNELLGEGWHQMSINVSMITLGFYHVILETPSGKTISKVLVSH